MDVDILRGPKRWDEVRSAWEQLAMSSPPSSFRQMPEWVGANDATSSDSGSRWVIARDEQGLLAVLPLRVERRSFGGVPVRLLSNTRYVDGVSAPRCSRGALRTPLLRALAATGERVHVVSLVDLREDAAAWAIADETVEPSQEAAHGGYAVLDVRSDFDTWFAAASKNLRSNVRRAQSRAEKVGEVQVSVDTDPDRVATVFDEFVRIEATGWKGAAGALVNRPTQRANMRRFMLDAARNGRASVRSLSIGDRLAGAQLVCRVGDTMTLLKLGHDDELSRLSPGTLLLTDLVRSSCADPEINRIDLITDLDWYQRWNATSHPTFMQRSVNRRTVLGALGSVVRRDGGRRAPAATEPAPLGV